MVPKFFIFENKKKGQNVFISTTNDTNFWSGKKCCQFARDTKAYINVLRKCRTVFEINKKKTGLFRKQKAEKSVFEINFPLLNVSRFGLA